jgi:hypothetical protein
MSLSHEHVGSKIPAKINTYMLTIAELHIYLCYEIPCMCDNNVAKNFKLNFVMLRIFFQRLKSYQLASKFVNLLIYNQIRFDMQL